MSFLNYIGEFFLFRWLFGKIKKSTTEHYAHTDRLGTAIDRDSEHLNDNLDGGIAPIEGAVTPSGNNLLDVYDNSEELDDMDIFMRDKVNNRSYLHHGDYDSDYNSNGRHSSHNDWNSGSYSQSYDEFHDEQDDYDMMDDDF